ncbi:hypothetical protein AWB71_02753 [Caballeronia peredens]|nr:hypothetical protein AWB71_02753 [Caballeronia peredens]
MLQAVDTKSEVSLCVLSVRYEGNDAASHETDLNQLGVSIQGFACVFALCANTLATGRLSEDFDALDVRVVSLPVAEHHCFEVLVMVKSMATSKELWSGAFGAVLAVVVQYVLSRRDQDQMKYLNEAMQVALRNNQAVSERFTNSIDRMMTSIDKLADALRPAARQALAPIERSCKRIDLHTEGGHFMTLNAEHKRAFAENEGVVSERLAPYVGVISQFDMATGACRITLDGDTARIPAIVIDPVFGRPKNRYVEAMASADSIRVLAKADLDGDGIPVRLYISEISERKQEPAPA